MASVTGMEEWAIKNLISGVQNDVSRNKDLISKNIVWRGRVPSGQNPDLWKPSDACFGFWSIDNTSALNVLLGNGYTPPPGVTIHYLLHIDSSEEPSGSFQMAFCMSASLSITKVFVRHKGFGKSFQPWVPLSVRGDGGGADIRGSVTTSGKSPDDFSTAETGIWFVPDYSSQRFLSKNNFDPPGKHDQILLTHSQYSDSYPLSVQELVYIKSGKKYSRSRQSVGSGWTEWSLLNSGEINSSDKSGFLALGDSWVQGGSNGKLWDDGSEWPSQLKNILNVDVFNAGRGGAFVDEIILQTGSRRTYLKLSSTSIPSSGSIGVSNLSWSPDLRGPRWVSFKGYIKGAYVALEQNGKTGVWTVRRLNDVNLGNQEVYLGNGWVEWTPELKLLYEDRPTFLRIGNNNLNNVKGINYSDIDHVLSGISEIIDTRPHKGHDLVLMSLCPHYGNDVGRKKVEEINRNLKQNYPRQFFDIPRFFFDLSSDGAISRLGWTPTEDDKNDISSGFIPHRFYEPGDDTHVYKPAHKVLAQKISEVVLNRGMILQ